MKNTLPPMTSVVGPNNVVQLLTRRQRQMSLPGHERARGPALQELLADPSFRTRLDRIRAESNEYTQTGLKRLMDAVRPEPIPREIFDMYAQSQIEGLTSRGRLVSAAAARLRTSSSDDVAPRLLIETLNPNSYFQYAHIHSDGGGDGLDYATLFTTLFTWPILLPVANLNDGGNWNFAQVEYRFSFTPPADGYYSFSTTLMAYGTYGLAADDGWPDSKEAACRVSGWLIAPYESASDHRWGILFERGDDNILEASTFAGIVELSSRKYCQGGKDLDLYALMMAEVSARGAGSIADLDLSQNRGAFVCTGLKVTQL